MNLSRNFVNFGSILRSYSSQKSVIPLNYTQFGDRNSLQPIVILHGLLGSSNNWVSIARNINRKTNRLVLAVDARNHGQSPHHPDNSYPDMSADLNAFIEVWIVKCNLSSKMVLCKISLGLVKDFIV